MCNKESAKGEQHFGDKTVEISYKVQKAVGKVKWQNTGGSAKRNGKLKKRKFCREQETDVGRCERIVRENQIPVNVCVVGVGGLDGKKWNFI